MWWMATGLVAAVLALPFALRLLRRRAERARIDLIKTKVDCSLSAHLYGLPVFSGGHTAPDGTTALDPPTEGRLSPTACAVRPRRTLMFGALYPNISVGPAWRIR